MENPSPPAPQHHLDINRSTCWALRLARTGRGSGEERAGNGSKCSALKQLNKRMKHPLAFSGGFK